MKTKFSFFATLVLSVLLLCACSKKDDVASEEYTNLTPEQNKQAIESAGTTFLSQVDGMKNLSALNVLSDFIHLTDNSEMKSAPIRDFVAPFVDIQQNVGAAMKMHVIGSGMQTLADLFNDYAGIYTYRASTNKWSAATSTSEITYNFSAGSSSNASVSLNNFTYTKSPIAFTVGDYKGVLVKSVTLTIKNQGATVGSLVMTGEYNTDGTPSKINETLSFNEGYAFTSTFTNNGSAVNFEQSLKKGSTELLSSHFDGKGDFSYNTIQTGTDSDDRDDIAKIISGGNAWVKVGNIELIGKVDMKSILTTLPYKIDNTNKKAVDQEDSIISKYTTLYAKYIDKNQIIAKSEFYSMPCIGYNYSYTYDRYYGYRYIRTPYTYYEVGLRFKFKDDSYMDENFFQTGFDPFIEQLTALGHACDINYNIHN